MSGTAHAPRDRSLGDLIRGGERSISFEFMPPRDEAGAAQLWQAIRDLEPFEPTFVSVTYGAGGTTRDTTVQITGRIARETSLRAMGHLTCVGHTREELVDILTSYREAGVRHILALRGDPPGGPGSPWTPTEGGLTYASELVALIRRRPDMRIGVAVGVQDLDELLAGVAHAREVTHRPQRRLAGDPAGDLDGRVPGAAAGAVGDRHEGRVEGLQVADRLPQLLHACVVLGRHELEGDGALPLANHLADAATASVDHAVQCRESHRPGRPGSTQQAWHSLVR